MLYWSLLFLLLALGAGAAGVGGVAGFSAQAGCGLFMLGGVMAVIALLIEGRAEPRKLPLRRSLNKAGERP